MENEIWKDVEEFENYYKISNYGRLISKERLARKTNGFFKIYSKIKTPQDNGKGYMQFYVQINKKRHIQYVHRLVAKYFIDNQFNLPEVNHIDGNKSNNNINNLEWVSGQQNKDHAVKNNLTQQGEKHFNSKLTKEKIIAIRKLHLLKPNLNQAALSRKLNVSGATIHNIINSKRWKHI